MTDYRRVGKKAASSKERDRLFSKKKIHVSNEKEGMVSKRLETDSLLRTHAAKIKTFKPQLKIKEPSTFAFYGSAERYYADATYNILNYYPFDGTKEEIIGWHTGSHPLDSAILNNYWPGSVGHLNLRYSEYVTFYNGPQSLSTAEFPGNFKNQETGLKLDPVSGNTVEFWLKKEAFNAAASHEEVIFDIGTYPGQVNSALSGQFRLALSSSSPASPFILTYKSGSTGFEEKVIGSSTLTTASLPDSQWHHYAIKVWHADEKLQAKMYVDGKYDSSISASIASMGSVDTYMGGAIGADQASTGSLSGSVDDFRFWKGDRDARDIARNFDKRVYASDPNNRQYKSRLGLYYRFNKKETGINDKDSLVMDHSGNDMTGRIKNYATTSRESTSAINVSAYTRNTEPNDPIMDLSDSSVQSARSTLASIGQSYDANNHSMLRNFLPEWAQPKRLEPGEKSKDHFSVLLQLMAAEFDLIKLSIDQIYRNKSFKYIDMQTNSEDVNGDTSATSSYVDNFMLGCTDNAIVSETMVGNSMELTTTTLEQMGFKVVEEPIISVMDPVDQADGVYEEIRLEASPSSTKNAIINNMINCGLGMIQAKGTVSAAKSVLHCYGVGEDIIGPLTYGNNTSLDIRDDKHKFVTEEKNSVYLGQNRDVTIFLSAGADSEARTYIAATSDEAEYTFEGTFIFPEKTEQLHPITLSSIFGVQQVGNTNNVLTTITPNSASFQVSAEKINNESTSARFKLSSNSSIISDIYTPYFPRVYNNGRWNLSVKVIKDADNKFVSPSTSKYKVQFEGYNYILDNLQNSFSLSTPLTATHYTNFLSSNKSIFLGAHRTNITGTVLQSSDIKIVNFSAWNDSLTSEELQLRAQGPSITGRNTQYLYNDKHNTKNKLTSQNLIMDIRFDTNNEVPSSGILEILDQSSGSLSSVREYGSEVGYKYPAKSTQFTTNIGQGITREHLPVVRALDPGTLHEPDNVSIKSSELKKFELGAKPEGKIISFEKSMYQAISREMINFLSGVRSLNNLIGDPVNKYRKDYKLMNHLRSKFFEKIENENQFERYVRYYIWMDSSIGKFLEQVLPASVKSNTGIENVVESHILERNKYDHKLPFVKDKNHTSISATLLSINELLYDWKHGHVTPVERTGEPGLVHTEHNHCLWQKERKPRTGDRETIRKVLTTVVTGSGWPGQEGYVRRNLVRPYKNTTTRQEVYSIGSNRKANKIKDFYKIINEGHEISIKSEDIYDFLRCDDVLNPQEEKIYTAKTDVLGTNSYLDGDADLLLPFSLYSSSVGYDFSDFKQNLKITNNHDSATTLQGTWVKTHTGGPPHRNVIFGTDHGNRPEAYNIESTTSSFTVKAPELKSIPRSMFHRSLAGARFYQIANIKTTTASLALGNYTKDYEIVHTNSRNLNNCYLVATEGAGLTGSLSPSLHISGVTNFAVPTRSRTEHVFVNRFSAPGASESMSAYGLDRESAEYSVYDTVNYRNPVVRHVKDVLSSEHSEKFGYRSSSATQASVHKTNRNALRLTASSGPRFVYDNNFIQHPIPQNDFGYAWVTASVNESVYDFLNKNRNIGYQNLFDLSGSLKSSETINFLSSSEMGTYHAAQAYNYAGVTEPRSMVGGVRADSKYGWTPIDITGLNYMVYEPISSSLNHLGYPQLTGELYPLYYNPHRPVISGNATARNRAGAKALNVLINNRQGPYGWPTWKQIRGANHPIIRSHRPKNIYSIVLRGNYPHPGPFPGLDYEYHDTREVTTTMSLPRYTKNYVEIFATARFNPLRISIHKYAREGIVNYLRDIDSSIPMAQNTLSALWHNDEYWYPFLDQSINVDVPSVSMHATVQNEVTAFANQEMADDMNFKEDDFLRNKNLKKTNEFYRGAEASGLSGGSFKEINYIETIYPKEINTYTRAARHRENFDFFGWNSVRGNRSLILSGALDYGTFLVSNSTQKSFLIPSTTEPETEFKNSYFNSIEAVDLNATGTMANITSSAYITSSTWVLDSRSDFSSLPVSLTSSFFLNGDAFLSSREQGTRGEGILQNDYSIFAMGYNGLRGGPPFAPVYNRRIPQSYGGDFFLAGEAQWTAADGRIGPFYDKYEDYASDIRLVGQGYSLIPEFTMSRFIEDIYSAGDMQAAAARDDFLHLTGATYHASSGEVSVGSQFFKTYSTTDFMKYFQPMQENIRSNGLSLAAGRLTLRCQAAMKLLPYRGFYPAERLVQISELFHRGYMKTGSYAVDYISSSAIPEADAHKLLNLRIENSRAAALKPLMAPGVLFNSIKAGLAVDYPLFSSSVDTGIASILAQKYDTPVTSYPSLSLGSSTCFTGSLVNSSVDAGIPRISGSVSRRIDFEDILNPVRLMKEVIYDNEPHPSASLMYGTAQWTKVLERPSRFGFLDQKETKAKLGLSFNMSEDGFQKSMLPYKSAVNNFTAETVEFFLQDQKLQTIMSEAVEPQLIKGVTYKMRVYLKNEDTVMYDRHSAFGPPVDDGSPSISSYAASSSGPVGFTFGSLASNTSTKAGSHGFLPYVPPFLDPNTSPYMEISYLPTETRNYSIPEIVEDISVSYHNMDPPDNAAVNINYKESMSLSASIDFKRYAKFYSDNFVKTGDGLNSPIDPNSTNKYRWIIQPKWETPIMNFKSVIVPTLKLGTSQVGEVVGSPWKNRYQTTYYEKITESDSPYLTSSTGMWHQSGTILKESDAPGYYLTVQGSRDDIKNKVGDLASAVGFLSQDATRSYISSVQDSRSVKLGRLAKKRNVSEAIVAIPYYLEGDCAMKMFPLNPEALDRANSINQDIETRYEQAIQMSSNDEEIGRVEYTYAALTDSTGRDASTSIAYQLRMMNKYILPPHFDFVRNPDDIAPHVAYIFQFKAELTQEDLASIWQNMYPKPNSPAVETSHSHVNVDPRKSDVEYITGYLKPEDIPILAGRESNYKEVSKFLENDVRWLVFKVKYRASNLYKDTVINSISPIREEIMMLNRESVESTKGAAADKDRDIFSKFGYNWPYDYFSIAELIKIESKVDFYTTTAPPSEQEEPMQVQSFGYTAAEASTDTTTETTSYEIVSGPASGGGSSEEVLIIEDINLADLMVTREQLKETGASPSSPANQLTAATATIKSGTETLYINGALQAYGANKDYTISGNTITLTFDLSSDDSAYITYVKE